MLTADLSMTGVFGAGATPSLPKDLWVLKGDEELDEFDHKSRTAAPTWPGHKWTPSVFRFDRDPVAPKNDYRVDISQLDAAIRALNGNDDGKANYLYSPTAGLFNSSGYPKQAYITMSGNLLHGTPSGNYLSFETITPGMDVTQLSFAATPWLVHTYDLVGWVNNETRHAPYVSDPPGDIYYFLVTQEGHGYIPLDRVRQVTA